LDDRLIQPDGEPEKPHAAFISEKKGTPESGFILSKTIEINEADKND